MPYTPDYSVHYWGQLITLFRSLIICNPLVVHLRVEVWMVRRGLAKYSTMLTVMKLMAIPIACEGPLTLDYSVDYCRQITIQLRPYQILGYL